MEDKKQDVNSLEELSKAADEFRKWAVDFGNKLSKVLADIQTSKKAEDTWEMKYPYEEGEKYWVLYDDGTVNLEAWLEYGNECNTFNQGNAFQTKEEAELESKRRNLLTRFRAFRDECNRDWKPDWNDHNSKKWVITNNEEGIYAMWTIGLNGFSYFGCFKNKEDAKRAIDLFGKEIKELFVDCEG